MSKPLDEKIVTNIVKTEVINALHDFYQDVLEPNLATKNELTKGLDSLETKLTKKIDENTYQIKQLEHKIDDVKADLSDTPNRREFDAPKLKVDTYHPAIWKNLRPF